MEYSDCAYTHGDGLRRHRNKGALTSFIQIRVNLSFGVANDIVTISKGRMNLSGGVENTGFGIVWSKVDKTTTARQGKFTPRPRCTW